MQKLPEWTQPALWGAVVGAIALAYIGFAWGGWLTPNDAELAAQDRIKLAVAAALAPLCVERFRQAADSAMNLVALKKLEAWSQGDFIEKGGWAASPGAGSPAVVSAVAKACATKLAGT